MLELNLVLKYNIIIIIKIYCNWRPNCSCNRAVLCFGDKLFCFFLNNLKCYEATHIIFLVCSGKGMQLKRCGLIKGKKDAADKKFNCICHLTLCCDVERNYGYITYLIYWHIGSFGVHTYLYLQHFGNVEHADTWNERHTYEVYTYKYTLHVVLPTWFAFGINAFVIVMLTTILNYNEVIQ